MLRCSRWGVRIHQSGVIPRWSAVRTRRWGVRRSSRPHPLCLTPAAGSGRPLSLKRRPLVPRSPRTRRKKRPKTGDSLVSQSKNSTGDSSVLHHKKEQGYLVSLYWNRFPFKLFPKLEQDILSYVNLNMNKRFRSKSVWKILQEVRLSYTLVL